MRSVARKMSMKSGDQKKDWNMGIAGSLQAQTLYDEDVPAQDLVKRCIAEVEMTVGLLTITAGEHFWLVAVSVISPLFPHRYFAVVCRDGEYQCSRELPKVAAIAIEFVKQHRLHRRAATYLQVQEAC